MNPADQAIWVVSSQRALRGGKDFTQRKVKPSRVFGRFHSILLFSIPSRNRKLDSSVRELSSISGEIWINQIRWLPLKDRPRSCILLIKSKKFDSIEGETLSLSLFCQREYVVTRRGRWRASRRVDTCLGICRPAGVTQGVSFGVEEEWEGRGRGQQCNETGSWHWQYDLHTTAHRPTLLNLPSLSSYRRHGVSQRRSRDRAPSPRIPSGQFPRELSNCPGGSRREQWTSQRGEAGNGDGVRACSTTEGKFFFFFRESRNTIEEARARQ